MRVQLPPGVFLPKTPRFVVANSVGYLRPIGRVPTVYLPRLRLESGRFSLKTRSVWEGNVRRGYFFLKCPASLLQTRSDTSLKLRRGKVFFAKVRFPYLAYLRPTFTRLPATLRVVLQTYATFNLRPYLVSNLKTGEDLRSTRCFFENPGILPLCFLINFAR